MRRSNAKPANGIGPARGPSVREVVELRDRKRRGEDAERLAEALQGFTALVAYLQRTTNPEEWATHGDWNRVQARGLSALAHHNGRQP